MKSPLTCGNGRRSFLKHAATAIGAAASWGNVRAHEPPESPIETVRQNVNANSKPSDLKITDLRAPDDQHAQVGDF